MNGFAERSVESMINAKVPTRTGAPGHYACERRMQGTQIEYVIKASANGCESIIREA
jgi:hypothetical protein